MGRVTQGVAPMMGIEVLVLEALDGMGGVAFEGEILASVCARTSTPDDEPPRLAREIHAALVALEHQGLVWSKAVGAGRLWLAAWQPKNLGGR